MPLTRNQSNAASQARMAAASASETSTSKETNDQGGTSTEAEPPRRDSPENCSICLGPFNNKSFTSSCAHSFCFVCLKQWSKVKAECPLCKQPFTSIFYNIRSNQHYDIYELPHQPSNTVDYNIFNYVGGPIPSFTGPTHHLFSLSQPGFDADLTLSNFSRFQFRHRRYDRYLNPLIHGEHPYSFSGPSVNPSSHISAATWPRGAEEFRREVYRRRLGPPAVILGCENSTYRLTPAMVSASAHRIHRIMPWLTRELRVLLCSHQNVRLAISIIQPLLTQVTIDSIYFFDRVAPIIGRKGQQFVQEFVAFANSALTVLAYDRKAMYRRRDTNTDLPLSSSSTSSENDVVEVTDISPDDFPSGANANPSAPGPSQTQPLNLSRSGWDSPTPGPSWDAPIAQDSAVDRVSVSSESDDPVFRPDLRDSDSEKSKAGSDIIFVKYDKPWNERSPINLTTDSEGGEGNEPARKKKKSKHKKKKKELVDIGENSVSKKDKGKKSSSKSKQRDKSKGPSRAIDSEEDMETSEISKRRHSHSSTEHHKTKKHKRSKSRKKLSDREKVDKLFAQALSQNKDEHSSESEDRGVNVSAKHKEKFSTKEKSKKKKKSRKHSKDSHNLSNRHTYKKHHSGHKKSSNRLIDGLPEQHGRHPRTHSPLRQNQIGGPSRSDSMVNDNVNQHEASSSTMSHSVVPGFQPPYLGMADTVQHIPVNLWVSAWPTLSVSHTYPPPPPPIAMGQGVPQSSNASSSTMTSNPNGTTEPSRAHLDQLSISSDTSSDSNSESDDAQDLQIPSLQNVHSRTKQWLETNFPDLGRPQTSSSSIPSNNVNNMSSANSDAVATSAAIETPAHCSQNPSGSRLETDRHGKEKESDIVEVVSVGSGDEDVVVCSSDDSQSNAGDLWVIDVDDSDKKSNTNKSSGFSNENNLSYPNHVSTLQFNGNANNHPVSKADSCPGPSNIILPPVNKSFQPFKLQKKPAMAIGGKDPFFPPMTHSSDEDGEVDSMFQAYCPTSKSVFATEGMSTASKSKDTSGIEHFGDPASTTFVGSLTTGLNSIASIGTSLQSTETSNHVMASQTQVSVTTTSYTTTTSSIFSVLPPLTSSSHSSKPNISSGISYLPYASLPPPSSVSSILHYGSQSTIPPPPPPISLSLQFPPLFPQIPLCPTTAQSSNAILSSFYSSQNQITSAPSLQFLTDQSQESMTHSQDQLQQGVVNSTKENTETSNSNPHLLTSVNEPNRLDERISFEDNVRGSEHHSILENNGLHQICSQAQSTDIVSSERECANSTMLKETEDAPLCEQSTPANAQKENSFAEAAISRNSSTEIVELSSNDTLTPSEKISSHLTEGDCGKYNESCYLQINSSNQDMNDKVFDALDLTSVNSDLPTGSFSYQVSNDKPFDALDKTSDGNDKPTTSISYQDPNYKQCSVLDKNNIDNDVPTSSFSYNRSNDEPFNALDKSSNDNNVPTDLFSYQESNHKPFDAFDKNSDDDYNVTTGPFSHQESNDQPFDALDKSSSDDNVTTGSLSYQDSNHTQFDALDKSNDVPTDVGGSFTYHDLSHKHFDAFNKNNDDNGVSTGSVSYQESNHNKPFDALENTMGNNLNSHVGSTKPCILNPVLDETPTLTTIMSPIIVPETSMQPSAISSIDQCSKSVSHFNYQSDERQPESLSVFKPYTDKTDQPLHQFTDALASSDSDNDK